MTDLEQVLEDSGINDRLTTLNTAAGELAALCEQVNKKMEDLAALGVSTTMHVMEGAYRVDIAGKGKAPPYLRAETFMILKG